MSAAIRAHVLMASLIGGWAVRVIWKPVIGVARIRAAGRGQVKEKAAKKSVQIFGGLYGARALGTHLWLRMSGAAGAGWAGRSDGVPLIG